MFIINMGTTFNIFNASITPVLSQTTAGLFISGKKYLLPPVCGPQAGNQSGFQILILKTSGLQIPKSGMVNGPIAAWAAIPARVV